MEKYQKVLSSRASSNIHNGKEVYKFCYSIQRGNDFDGEFWQLKVTFEPGLFELQTKLFIFDKIRSDDNASMNGLNLLKEDIENIIEKYEQWNSEAPQYKDFLKGGKEYLETKEAISW